MGNEKYFDENVILYDKYRPTYVSELYSDMFKYADIPPSSNILEVGCGTGKATLPLIQTGAKVTAVELGKNLAEFTKEKFKSYDNFSVINKRFEDFETTEKYDLIVSATAFHWIPHSFGYPRCLQLLKNNGVLAVFWTTVDISNENIELKNSINKLYDKYKPEQPWSYKKRCEDIQDFFKTNNYRDIYFRIYKNLRTFNADSYIGLLHTYSDHMSMPAKTRNVFFEKIHQEISKHGSIVLEDKIDLHMGRK